MKPNIIRMIKKGKSRGGAAEVQFKIVISNLGKYLKLIHTHEKKMISRKRVYEEKSCA
jgi:hypothetical protein